MAEQTNIQIDTLARAIQIVTDFLAGRPQQGVASSNRPSPAPRRPSSRGSEPERGRTCPSRSCSPEAGFQRPLQPIEIARNMLDDRQPSFLQGGDGAHARQQSRRQLRWSGQSVRPAGQQPAGQSVRPSRSARQHLPSGDHRPSPASSNAITLIPRNGPSSPETPQATACRGPAHLPSCPSSLDGMNPGCWEAAAGTGSGLANQGPAESLAADWACLLTSAPGTVRLHRR
jgi:hypothetical protein